MDTPQTGTDEEFAAALDAALGTHGPKLSGPGADRGGWSRGRTTREVENPIHPRQQLQNLSQTHEFIMNWLIANPGKPLKALQAVIGYSQAYLSILIHSDLFQARLREKQDEVFGALKEDLSTKLGALADIGVEKLTEQLETSTDPRFIHEVTKTALTTLGFGSKPAAGANTVNAQNVQQNFYVASPADLEAARGRMARPGGPVSSPEANAPSAPGEATLIPCTPPEEPAQEPGPALEPDPIQAYLNRGAS